MARRRAKTRRRRSRSFSILNAIESYAYANILTRGMFDANPVEFLTGEGDLSPSTSWTEAGLYGATSWLTTGGSGASIGASPMSLADLIKNPSYALAVTQYRTQSNLPGMLMQSLATGVGFRLIKRVLRAPISNVNRNIVRPIMGKTVRL